MRRRRFLAVVAAAGAVAATPARAFRLERVEWRGVALGAPARLLIHHEDRAAAIATLGAVEAEIARLEAVFSLYRPNSALSRLNRAGRLEAPPLDLVAVLALAGRVHHASDGAFDPTVQPLWQAHAQHFSRPGADPSGPPPEAVERARGRVGWHRVAFDSGLVTLAEGAALTLNGIAQGYVTDRVVALLRRQGLRHVLADMGEVAAVGGRGDGSAWSAALPEGGRRMLADGALAVSAADGTRFSPACHHLFDPRSGRCAAARPPVVAVASTAALADAASTAAAAGGPAVEAILRRA